MFFKKQALGIPGMELSMIILGCFAVSAIIIWIIYPGIVWLVKRTVQLVQRLLMARREKWKLQ